MTGFPRANLSRLALGTAQFGLVYGKVRRTEPPSAAEVGRALDQAVTSGITCIDTAGNYGEAETRVGDWLKSAPQTPIIVSKLPPFFDVDDSAIETFVRANFQESLRRLGIQRLDAYLVHRAADLHRPGVAGLLEEFRDSGGACATGVSVYEPEQLDDALQEAVVDVVQLPASAADQRFLQAGLLERCRDGGVTVFARSAFLQGVLLMDAGAVPEFLAPLRGVIGGLASLAGEAGCTRSALCLAAVLAQPGIDSVVIGVADAAELKANLAAFRNMPGPNVAAEALRLAADLPAELLDPRRWPDARPAPAGG